MTDPEIARLAPAQLQRIADELCLVVLHAPKPLRTTLQRLKASVKEAWNTAKEAQYTAKEAYYTASEACMYREVGALCDHVDVWARQALCAPAPVLVRPNLAAQLAGIACFAQSVGYLLIPSVA